VAAGRYPGLNGLVVLRRGKLLIERYYGESTRDSLHDVRSVGKTLASAVLGQALRDGHLSSIDQPLGDFYDLKASANYGPKKELVTLRHLVSMSSGFDGFDFVPESVGNEENMYPQSDWVSWTLDLPMASGRMPGEAWSYFTAGVVLGDILARHIPGGLEVYAHEKLFAPLGIQNYAWSYTPQRVPNTAGGIRMRGLDLARFGQVYKDAGRMGETQVLPANWVKEALKPDKTTLDGADRYGRLFWHRSFPLGDADDPAAPRISAAYCSGNGGNKIYIFDDAPVVVVILSSAYGEGAAQRRSERMLTEYVLPLALD
jgi:CubicO group peptidase (beta-lactamase class C family)